ncbi:omptin family outer membrane protease [Treponema sp. OttesenSCG-928-L16]|nr:omptin family outer membrane protease [Treponema sp. OttesenSCG-928-L16]
MKNIPVFAFFVSIFMFFSVCPVLHADAEKKIIPLRENNLFFVTLSTGFLYGQAEEIVYSGADTDNYISQLLWDMKPLFYMGSSLEYCRHKAENRPGFFASLSVKFGIPSKSGIMEDRDWVSPDNAYLTHFSSHKNYTDGAVLLDLKGGFSFPVRERHGLKLYAILSYMHFKWTARDGYYQYADRIGVTDYFNPWDSSIPKTTLHGPAIAYSQDWLALMFGASFLLRFNGFFGTEFACHVGPVILCVARDDHFQRKLQFSDYMTGGICVEPALKFIFSPWNRVDFTFHVSYRYVGGTRGYAIQTDTYTGNETGPYKDSAGAGLSVMEAGLSFKVFF